VAQQGGAGNGEKMVDINTITLRTKAVPSDSEEVRVAALRSVKKFLADDPDFRIEDFIGTGPEEVPLCDICGNSLIRGSRKWIHPLDIWEYWPEVEPYFCEKHAKWVGLIW